MMRNRRSILTPENVESHFAPFLIQDVTVCLPAKRTERFVILFMNFFVFFFQQRSRIGYKFTETWKVDSLGHWHRSDCLSTSPQVRPLVFFAKRHIFEIKQVQCIVLMNLAFLGISARKHSLFRGVARDSVICDHLLREGWPRIRAVWKASLTVFHCLQGNTSGAMLIGWWGTRCIKACRPYSSILGHCTKIQKRCAEIPFRWFCWITWQSFERSSLVLTCKGDILFCWNSTKSLLHPFSVAFMCMKSMQWFQVKILEELVLGYAENLKEHSLFSKDGKWHRSLYCDSRGIRSKGHTGHELGICPNWLHKQFVHLIPDES